VLSQFGRPGPPAFWIRLDESGPLLFDEIIGIRPALHQKSDQSARKQTMKVLIISTFPPDPAPEANHALHISEHLAKSGLNVHILCKKGSIAATQENVVVHPVINDWSWSDLPGLIQCMRSCLPDVVLLVYLGWVYNHEPLITFLPTVCKTFLPTTPCVTQFEAIDLTPRPRSHWSRALRKTMKLWAGNKNVHRFFGTLLRDSDRIIALSSSHKARLIREHQEVQEKCVVIPPPPLIRSCRENPVTVRKQSREAIGAAETDFVILYWGYIYPGKGIETLIKAFQIACRRNPNLRLVLVGGRLDFPTGQESISCKDYFQMVRQLPEELGIAERVTWTGNFSWDSDIGSRYLYAGDLCVLPFDYGVTLNNSSLAAASTHGLPVISTEVPDERDEALEHGQNIYLCPTRDPEMLAEAIDCISKDSECRERLRAGILGLAKDWYHETKVTDRLIKVLESAISSRQVSGHHKSYVTTCEAQLRTKGESAELCLHEFDGVHADRQLSSSVWPEEKCEYDGNAPLVSVIVAVHNVEKYLSQCLDSLVHQTLKDIEIVVVNDASTDNSFKIINEYKSNYPNLRVVNCEYNKGLASVRNIGMRVARGRYIGFLDGDDWADIRMCEVMYRRAKDDNADVLIADVTVFYEDSKTFGQFFDQHIRRTLDPRLRTAPFELRREPRIMLLEPVAWPKLYRRSFLQRHALHFEAGMNSYEDICFHFSVLMKATRISLIDDALFYYRQNRAGQISGRRDRRVFEVFAVFDRIRENLAAWGTSAEIWALLIRVQLRQFDWLLKDRVQPDHKREFMSSVQKQFRMIPKEGFRQFACKANLHELAKLVCMRQNWLSGYEELAVQRWPAFPGFYLMLYRFYQIRYGRQILVKRAAQRCRRMVRRRLIASLRYCVKKSIDWAAVERELAAMNDRLNELLTAKALPARSEESCAEVYRIKDQTLILSDKSCKSGLADAVWRMTNDYHLSQMAIFREGDTVIDVGAHVGIFSIFLAKRFPFIKIYAIEPDPINYRSLKQNIELNGLTNVTAIHKAISGDGRNRKLYASLRDSRWVTTDAKAAGFFGLYRTMPVETLTLDQFFQNYEIEHCRVLKLNAIGAIQECLDGFTRKGCVDFLTGEMEFEDCRRVRLEMASWRIARQHFWRILDGQKNGSTAAWFQQLPRGCNLGAWEDNPARSTNPTTSPAGVLQGEA
jgi:polysaccharide biosynthesis protein PslF